MLPNHVLRAALWLITAVLCTLGLVMIASATGAMGVTDNATLDGGINGSFVTKQIAALVIGVFLAGTVSLIGPDFLRKDWVIALLAAGTIVLIAIPLAIGPTINGARRWIQLGPVNLQPAEIAKLVLVFIASWYFTRIAERIRVPWYGALLPLMGFGVLAGLVFATKDLGSVVVMAVLLWIIILYAGAPWFYTTLLGLCCLPLAAYITIFREPYRRDRFFAYIDPMSSDNPAAYHLQQSFIAIGSGGLWGRGLGRGDAATRYLPEHHTDFIYAIIAQELGFVGAITVAGLYLLLIALGVKIALRTREHHHRLLAIGATMLIGLQAFWNMLMVVGAVPTKGLTLPFISYGGSSIMVCLAAIGVLDAVIARANVPEAMQGGTGTYRIGATQTHRRVRVITEELA